MNCKCNMSTQPDCFAPVVSGLCDPTGITAVISENPYWKQMYISEKVCVPEAKPDIESINAVDISVEILRKEVIVTPESVTPNLEGKQLSGRKLIIEGVLTQVISYTALSTTQPVHTFHTYVPFSSFIVVPKEINLGTASNPNLVDSLFIDYIVDACIEDLSVSLASTREVLKQVTLLLYASPTNS